MIEFKYTRRPINIPINLRLYRRLAMLCIILSKCCRGGAASFKQLHFLNSLFISDSFRESYFDFKLKKYSLKLLPSADPFLNRCVNYAIGARLIAAKDVKSGFRVSLTNDGEIFLKSIKDQKLAEDMFDIASQIGKVSEKDLSVILKMEI